jgi:uncharacterized protein
LLEILACPIDKHTPLELFEINVILTNNVSHSVNGTDVTDTKSENDKPKVAENRIIKEGVLFCSECSRFFPIIDEIPIMLPDELREKDKDLQFLRTWRDKIPRKILEYGQPWHLD